MKTKALLLTMMVMSFMLTSCSPKILYTKSIGFVDYSVYQHNGIFLTESNSVNFEYETIGSVTAVVYSGNVTLSQTQYFEKKDLYGDDTYGKKTTVKTKTEWKTASPEDALQAAVAQVISKGGDGLINIKITPSTEIDASKKTRSGFLVTGMAIKRK